ncbi:hypothetical protein R3P38DRAFT_2918614 [Favolaschia claudopus]|uniref:Uncharacterized protein n=1 Tax=Favolaschia claudopus TaxID=2862362 RepID=A0AAW0C1Q3_9AGAR
MIYTSNGHGTTVPNSALVNLILTREIWRACAAGNLFVSTKHESFKFRRRHSGLAERLLLLTSMFPASFSFITLGGSTETHPPSPCSPSFPLDMVWGCLLVCLVRRPLFSSIPFTDRQPLLFRFSGACPRHSPLFFPGFLFRSSPSEVPVAPRPGAYAGGGLVGMLGGCSPGIRRGDLGYCGPCLSCANERVGFKLAARHCSIQISSRR